MLRLFTLHWSWACIHHGDRSAHPSQQTSDTQRHFRSLQVLKNALCKKKNIRTILNVTSMYIAICGQLKFKLIVSHTFDMYSKRWQNSVHLLTRFQIFLYMIWGFRFRHTVPAIYLCIMYDGPQICVSMVQVQNMCIHTLFAAALQEKLGICRLLYQQFIFLCLVIYVSVYITIPKFP